VRRVAAFVPLAAQTHYREAAHLLSLYEYRYSVKQAFNTSVLILWPLVNSTPYGANW
jgi:hypothetical protein